MKQIVAGQTESVDRGPDVPLVLDEPLAQLSGEALSEWLDAILDRPGQAVYLTDDPAVATWARSRRRRPAVAHRLRRLGPPPASCGETGCHRDHFLRRIG